MRKIISVVVSVSVLCFLFSTSFCQATAKSTTYILFRHAEKDTGNNPPLTAAGVKRAEKLPTLFGEMKPTDFYSTPYIRTRQTIAPWAAKQHKQVQDYDANKLAEFAEILKNQKGKIIAIAGHSNTTPALVNLLIGSQKYGQINDSDYGKIFIVTISENSIEDKVITY